MTKDQWVTYNSGDRLHLFSTTRKYIIEAQIDLFSINKKYFNSGTRQFGILVEAPNLAQLMHKHQFIF